MCREIPASDMTALEAVMSVDPGAAAPGEGGRGPHRRRERGGAGAPGGRVREVGAPPHPASQSQQKAHLGRLACPSSKHLRTSGGGDLWLATHLAFNKAIQMALSRTPGRPCLSAGVPEQAYFVCLQVGSIGCLDDRGPSGAAAARPGLHQGDAAEAHGGLLRRLAHAHRAGASALRGSHLPHPRRCAHFHSTQLEVHN